MKNLFLMGAVFFGCLFAQNGYSQQNTQTLPQNQARPDQGPVDYQAPGYQEGRYQQRGYQPQGCTAQGCPVQAPTAGDQCCEQPQAAPCDQACNDCWCLYCHYEPCYYTTKRCVEEQIPCKKKCCRMVPQYYQVQRCKYVPQYYCETCCRQVPEYYDVDYCKTCKKWVCDQHCKYVPKYYWKHTCGANGGSADCAPCQQ
jgi:hypothetical protein